MDLIGLGADLMYLFGMVAGIFFCVILLVGKVV